jgi:tetratricopeptide (TPR) repeat protein
MNIRSLLSGILLCALLVACGSPRQAVVTLPATPIRFDLSPEQQRKYDYFFLEALRMKTQGDDASVFTLLQHCLEIDPDGASALNEIAQCYLQLKQIPQAQAALEHAARVAPDNYWYGQSLASLYLHQSKSDSAATVFEELSRRFPDNPEPLYNLYDIYSRQNAYAKSIDVLNRLEEKLGKSEQFTMEKFRIYVQQQNRPAALREIESLVKEYPQEPRYRVVLGDVYLQNNKLDEALRQYRRVLADDPDNTAALYSMASYYREKGDSALYRQQLDTLLLNRKVATDIKMNIMRQMIIENEQTVKDSIPIIRLFDRIMDEEPDDDSLPMLYAQYLLTKNMNKQAVPVLNRALDIDPSNTAARMTLLGEAVRKEDYNEVIRLCEGGIVTNPDMPEFYFYLAIAYNQAERTDEALAICQKAVTTVNKDTKPEVMSDFYAIMGDIYHTKEMNREAYAAYDSALVYNSANIGALNNYAYYLSLERKDLDKAEEMSYRTVKAEPNNSTYLDTYAWILFEKGNYTEARIYIDNALLNNSDGSDVIIEHCGDIYYMTGDVEGALKFWRQALEAGSTSKTLKQKITQKKYIPE